MNSIVFGILITSALVLLGNSVIIRRRNSGVKEKKVKKKERKQKREIISFEQDEEVVRINKEIKRIITGGIPEWQKRTSDQKNYERYY